MTTGDRALKKRLAACSFLCMMLLCACGGPEKAPVPKLPGAVGQLSLARTLKGVAANKLIYNMHGKATSGSTSAVGYYGGRDAQNVLYVSAFLNDQQARRAFDRMLAKLAPGSSGFTAPVKRPDLGQDLYETSGFNLKHFFYLRGKHVVWWQAGPAIAEASLKTLRTASF